jgi:hypothetical protein
MSIGLKSDSSGTSGSIVINGSDAVLVTPTGITTASIQNSSITTAKIADGNVTTAKIADANITFNKLSTSTTEADNVASRTAKAWVNFDGTTNTGGNCTIRADFNVSTVADNGTGDYTINFSTSLADENYSCVGAASTQGVNGGVSWLPQTTSPTTIGTPLAGSLRGAVQAAGVGNIDSPFVNVAFFR